MVALNFPSAPTDKQTFNGYYWDATLGVWRSDPIPMGGLPAGSVMQWLTNTPPANWAVADGSLRSRVTDASLFAIIGTTYGVGDGTTTFALPDLRGRVPVGKNAGTFGTLGATGGAETHTLTEAQMPSHTHTGTTSVTGNHTHGGINNSTSSDGSTDGNVRRDGGANYNIIGFGAGDHAHTFTTNTAGSGAAHNNLQPYIVVNYIIKLSSGWSAGDSELATRLGVAEAKLAVTSGTIAWASGFSANTGGLNTVTKQNGIVTVNMRLNGTVGGGTLVATISTGFRPSLDAVGGAFTYVSTVGIGGVQVNPTGQVYGYASPSDSTNFGFNISYPAA